jgi:hypothetical protein
MRPPARLAVPRIAGAALAAAPAVAAAASARPADVPTAA